MARGVLLLGAVFLACVAAGCVLLAWSAFESGIDYAKKGDMGAALVCIVTALIMAGLAVFCLVMTLKIAGGY